MVVGGVSVVVVGVICVMVVMVSAVVVGVINVMVVGVSVVVVGVICVVVVGVSVVIKFICVCCLGCLYGLLELAVYVGRVI